jgi:16S rRNA (uracil1498-N3)-methyltransferase
VSLTPHVIVTESLVGATVGSVVGLSDVTVHHLRRALRRTDGSPLSVTDGTGGHASAELVTHGAALTSAPTSVAPPVPRLVLAQSLAKGRRADDAVRMACELGVDRIVPVVADRTQGRPDDRSSAAVVERWRALAVAALEQSRGTHLTQVCEVRSTAELAVDAVASDRCVRLAAVPGAPALPEVYGQALRGGQSGGADEVLIAVGPEGGWSSAEVERLVAAGWLAVGLGPTVLRTEHAGPVAIAVIAALAGRWRAPDEGR